MSQLFGLIFGFLMGGVMGSTANALMDRLNRDEAWTKGRSKCDSCKKTLAWYDLIPLFSYISLRGKCRYCGKKIATRNFWLELVMGVGFAVISAWYLVLSVQMILTLGIFWVTVLISVMDWETKMVSEGLVVLWGVAVVSYQLTSGQLGWENIVGLLVSVGVIGGLWAVSRGKAMGFGDVEIAAVMGWWLGALKIAAGLWVAFVAGAIYGLWLIFKYKKKLKSEIPFGPFLVFGAWVGYLGGEWLVNRLIS